jgi:SurA-like protein
MGFRRLLVSPWLQAVKMSPRFCKMSYPARIFIEIGGVASTFLPPSNVRYLCLALSTFLVFAGAVPAPAEIIDRILAVVNQQIITLGDVEQERKFQEMGLSEMDALQNREAKEKQVQFDLTQRLIEQNLIRQQIQQFPGTEVSAEGIATQIASIRDKFGGAERWEQTLRTLHITQEELKSRVEWQLQVMKFLDYRFRQFVIVDQKEIRDYYSNNLLPALAAKGIKEQPPLPEVEEKIREILTEEKLDVQLDEWLKSLKESASIEIFN